ncbi:hypothetical protein TNCV_3609481 [Trichonephila clavipes]|nr:hypothetical protein TNCV_3609481 [Trichonephila clavipes]
MSGCSYLVSGLHHLLNHTDSFPSQAMHFLHPCLEFLDILLTCAKGASGGRLNRRSAGRRRSRLRSIWDGDIRWSREWHSCRQAGKRLISCSSPVDYWIPGERGCSGCFN